MRNYPYYYFFWSVKCRTKYYFLVRNMVRFSFLVFIDVTKMMDNVLEGGDASPSSVSGAKEDDAMNYNQIQSSSEKVQPPPSPAAQSSNSKISHYLNTLEHLDKQHQHLLEVENSLQKYLDELKKEEKSLREALVQSSTTLKEQRRSETRQKEEEALARLEAALMNDDDSDGTSSS
jgi:predicted RNase H-like nuclease (RuvC/YqgF family)